MRRELAAAYGADPSPDDARHGRAIAIHLRILAEKAEEALERADTAREIADRARPGQVRAPSSK